MLDHYVVLIDVRIIRQIKRKKPRDDSNDGARGSKKLNQW